MYRILLLIICFKYGICYEDFVVSLPNGKISGLVTKTPRKNVTFYAFLGIPYAAPPIGDLRFKPPQPVQNWEGILETKSNEKICYQTDKQDHRETEDCLYINVYTPVEPGLKSVLPVMMNIYGGTFVHGSASFGPYPAQFVIEEGVIVVTMNYRVGPFGFLSTNDSVIPGNMGLKDQQFALKWVQNNIHLFGGDPNKVTLLGQSAGAASVTYQMLSPGSAGLFRAAIGQSGSALCTWAYQRDPVGTAYGIAIEIDPSFNRNKSTEELAQFLLSVDAKTIDNTGPKFHVFAPVIEVDHDGAIITESMYEAAENGRVNKIPLLIGINSEEEIAKAADIEALRKSATSFDKTPSLLVDADMYINDKDTLSIVGEKIREMYTNGLLQEHLDKTVEYYSDNRFTKAIIKFGELQSKYADVFFYQFSYHGLMGNNSVSLEGTGKVAHAEDLRYFWAHYDSLDGFPASDIRTLDRYVGLLTNFAKTLNPTPEPCDLFQNIIWPKVTNDNFYYLDIDEALSVRENPRNFSYTKWGQLYDEYVKKPRISF